MIQGSVESGKITTIREFFEENKHKVHIIDEGKGLGVILNGVPIRIGSIEWQLIEHTPILELKLFESVSIIKK